MSALATAALWLAPEWTMLPLAAQRCRVRNALNGAVTELTREQYAVLTACEGCATLDQHYATIVRKLDVRFEHRATVMQWLRDLASQRLLVPFDELIARIGAASQAVAPFAGVFVRTCDRPQLLARALASAATMEQRHGAAYGYTVLDDSRDPANRAANREAVRTSQLDARYIDLSEPTELERELRAALPGASSPLDWLLGPSAPGEATYGRPVNLALLLTAGRRLLMLDDDALLEPRRAPYFQPGFAVSSEADDLSCFADWPALEAACPPFDVDPVKAHVDALGESVGTAWRRLGDAAAAIQIGAADAKRFASGARVLFTQNGALGDPGSSLFPYHLLALSERSMMRNQTATPIAFRERIDWRGHDRMRLAPNRLLTFTTLAGLDNSVLLPPTVRAHRNEDLLLGEIAQHVHPAGWYVDLPWALPHRREPAKHWLGPTDRFAQEPAHFLLDHVSDRAGAIASETPEERLASIAALVRDIAHTSNSRLVELLEDHVADTSTRVLFAIANRLDDAQAPPAWKHALRPWQGSPALAVDRASISRRIAPPAAVRALAQSYSDALAVWPQLWRLASRR